MTRSASTLLLLFNNKNRLTPFALFWFLVNLLVESSIIPLEPVFEHRMYLPSMFPFLTGSAIKNFSKAIAIGQSDKTGSFGAGTITNQLATAHDGLASAYRETEKYTAAIQEAELALQLKPDMITPLVTLGITKAQFG